MRKIFAFIISLALLASLAVFSCAEPLNYDLPNVAVPIDVIKDKFTDRDRRNDYAVTAKITLSDGGCTVDGGGAVCNGTIITINAVGCYELTGSMIEGQLIINAGDGDKIQLVLDNAELKSSKGAAVLVKSADKVFITCAESSSNIIASAGDMKGQKIDAAVYSDCDLTFNGSGKLSVLCEDGHGILTKDDLKICSGSYNIVSDKQGISGKDSVRICGGEVDIISKRDGIHSEHTKSNKGYVLITGGTLSISSGKDGISASGDITVTDGKINIASGVDELRKSTDSSCACLKSASRLIMYGGDAALSSPESCIDCTGEPEIYGGRLFSN